MHVLDLLLSIHCLILLHEFNHDLLIHFRHFDRPIVCRPRITAEPKAPSTAETLETAAAVASIAADLEAPIDKEDEADEIIGRLETSSWQTVKEPSIDQKSGSEQCATAESLDKNKKRHFIPFF
ncbi:hypothetical protein X798_01536 [Onchocerca flexuosa]|uniref:Uncharacterized protein n=1 Tax=Onchocerca flexuosa TaxID=387005 RepID=A0A238C2J8_9BILA|nr:hypothetical protein X798_01536 [Onchocerca flexuosa]